MLNKKKIKNNVKLAINISLLKGRGLGKRALILSSPIEGIKELAFETPFRINDFFQIVIAESLEVADSLPFADFIIYDLDSPYLNNQLFLDNYTKHSDSIVCTNYNAMSKAKALPRSMNISNLNYLPSPDNGVSSDPNFVRGVECGLCAVNPGEHLAKILGCESVYINPELDNLKQFVTEKEKGAFGIERHLPTNIIQPKRIPFIKTI